MPEMLAKRDLAGSGYKAGPGQVFSCSDEVADSLMARGLAEPVCTKPVGQPGVATYETKVITPKVKTKQ